MAWQAPVPLLLLLDFVFYNTNMMKVILVLLAVVSSIGFAKNGTLTIGCRDEGGNLQIDGDVYVDNKYIGACGKDLGLFGVEYGVSVSLPAGKHIIKGELLLVGNAKQIGETTAVVVAGKGVVAYIKMVYKYTPEFFLSMAEQNSNFLKTDKTSESVSNHLADKIRWLDEFLSRYQKDKRSERVRQEITDALKLTITDNRLKEYYLGQFRIYRALFKKYNLMGVAEVAIWKLVEPDEFSKLNIARIADYLELFPDGKNVSKIPSDYISILKNKLTTTRESDKNKFLEYLYPGEGRPRGAFFCGPVRYYLSPTSSEGFAEEGEFAAFGLDFSRKYDLDPAETILAVNSNSGKMVVGHKIQNDPSGGLALILIDCTTGKRLSVLSKTGKYEDVKISESGDLIIASSKRNSRSELFTAVYPGSDRYNTAIEISALPESSELFFVGETVASFSLRGWGENGKIILNIFDFKSKDWNSEEINVDVKVEYWDHERSQLFGNFLVFKIGPSHYRSIDLRTGKSVDQDFSIFSIKKDVQFELFRGVSGGNFALLGTESALVVWDMKNGGAKVVTTGDFGNIRPFHISTDGKLVIFSANFNSITVGILQ